MFPMTMLHHESNAARSRILEAGLAEFDRCVARRRRARSAVAGLGGIAAIALVAALALGPGGRSAAPPPSPTLVRVSLPSYVEILDCDEQLVAELELADACERIGRSAGRLFVIECVEGDSSG
jgi:hypothetical protein